MEYHYFYFDPVTLDSVIWEFGDYFDESILEAAYALWGVQFIYKHERFSYHQSAYHELLIKQKFQRKHDLLIGQVDTWSIENQVQFSDYLDWSGCLDHYRLATYHKNSIQRELESHLAMAHTHNVSIPPGLISEITRLWFNEIIDNPPAIQSELRAMNYTKQYLKTKHWRRIRALKLLIHKNRCASSTCYKYNSFHFGEWTKELHVHHLSYESRGNERYDDVCLLCRTCHQAVTDNPNLEPEITKNLKLHTRLFTHNHK